MIVIGKVEIAAIAPSVAPRIFNNECAVSFWSVTVHSEVLFRVCVVVAYSTNRVVRLFVFVRKLRIGVLIVINFDVRVLIGVTVIENRYGVLLEKFRLDVC